MLCRLILSVLALLAGCAAPPTEPAAPTTQQAIRVPPDRILVKFKTLDCVCNLGDVEYSLLDLPEVSALDWDVTDDRVWLIFLGSDRPTDDAIRECVKYTSVRIQEIVRP